MLFLILHDFSSYHLARSLINYLIFGNTFCTRS